MTMKAFMSAGNSPLARMDAMFRARRAPGERAIADLALTEAEMILEETEPGASGWGKLPFPTMHPFASWNGIAWDGDPVYLFRGESHYNKPTCDDVRLALADALTAFVAMDICQECLTMGHRMIDCPDRYTSARARP